MEKRFRKIGFIVPNKTGKCRIASSAVSVDEAECVTGYDFLANLMMNLRIAWKKKRD